MGDAVGPEASHKLRVARLASANLASSQSNKGKREKMFSMSKQKDKERRASSKNDSVRTSRGQAIQRVRGDQDWRRLSQVRRRFRQVFLQRRRLVRSTNN